MTEKEKNLAEILAKLEKDRPEIDRILNRPAIIDTGRKPKELCRIPADADFTTRDGNTEYEVAGHFIFTHRRISAKHDYPKTQIQL